MRRTRIRRLRGAALVAFAVAVTGGGIIVTNQGTVNVAGVAHVWVESGAGACTAASATLISYADSASPDRRCGTLDAAWDQMSNGQVARVVAGTYAAQRVTGDKTAETRIVGEGDGDDVTFYTGLGGPQQAASCTNAWAAICADATFMALENVTGLTEDPGPAGGASIGAANVTFRDVKLRGDTSADGFYAPSIGVYAANFLWDGGELARPGQVATATCAHASIEPIWLQSGANSTVIDGVTVYPFVPKVQAGPNCGADNTPHLETIRLENADNVTVRNSYFDTGGGDLGSGHVFTSADPDNFKLINTRIEPRGTNAWIQLHANATANDWTLAYNTVTDTGGPSFPPGTVLVGNFGESLGCAATNIKNVYSGSGSCGTNTYIGAASFGLDSSLRLEAGSPAIDAAETPDASDYCTDLVGSVDYEGTVRPQGAVCDAGADERP